ncbi:DUF6338 family protein [Rhodococcoides fascians]|uniref:DUF6338 family protein n=1 Tax=Rhodococcoides fascians TaxID=1828 RepID=UPI00050C11AA
MPLPESLFQLLVLLVLVVPGIVFTYVRRWLRGPGADERDFSVRLVHAVAASVIFDCIYLIFGGPFLIKMFTPVAGEPSAPTQPREAGFFTLLLAVVIPLLVALLFHVRFTGKLWYPFQLAERRSSTPTAWDHVAPHTAECYVRVFTSDGYWVGGWLPNRSGYLATYPEPRDIFIPQQWRMSATGEFESPIEGSLGVYIPLAGSDRVEWISARRPSPDPS